MNPRRIGLYGGSFDPVHCGHLLVARAAVEELKLDRLFFIPAAQSPFKPKSQPLAGPLRLRLLRLALAGLTWAEVDDGEIQRGGVSYTIDTVQSYHRRHPGSELWYLVGADHIGQLPSWRSAADLARLARFAVIPRPGQTDRPLPSPFQGQCLKGFPSGVSSSEIRTRIRGGLSIDGLVSAPVAEAIANYRLYL